MLRSLPKRVALVTGGAQGLGRAIAERLASDGASVVIGDVDVSRMTEAVNAFVQSGIDATAQLLDVSSESSVLVAFEAIEQKFGRLDILINNAGVIGLLNSKRPLVEEMPLGLWQRTLDVNLTGTFLASRSAIPLMKRNKWGRIVNVSSRAARTRTGFGHSNYAASKSGLIGFSRVLAGELGRDGITVNCIAPSRVVTAMTRALARSSEEFERNIAETAVGRLAELTDVAASVAFLCSDDAQFITGIVLDVNGGSYMP